MSFRNFYILPRVFFKRIDLFKVLIAFVLFSVLLIHVYKEQVVPFYSYQGLVYNQDNFYWLILGFLINGVQILVLHRYFSDITGTFFWLLFLFLIAPFNYVIYLITNSIGIDILIYILVFNFSFYLLLFASRVNPKVGVLKSQRFDVFGTLMPVIGVILVVLVFSYTGFNLHVSIEDIYDRRLEARNVLRSGSIKGYLESVLSGIVIPMLFVDGIVRRKTGNLVIVFFAILVVFSLKGSKGVVFSPLYLGSIVWIKSKFKNETFVILMGLIIVLVACELEKIFYNTSIFANLVIRRKFIVPSQLSFYYWEYFSEHGLVYMKDSIIGSIIPMEPRYNIQRSRLIGYEYFGKIEYNANANIFATAYADFGYMGMIISSLLAGIIIRWINLFGKGRALLVSSTMAYIAIVWSEGALYTSILTNGVLLILIIYWLQGNGRNDCFNPST